LEFLKRMLVVSPWSEEKCKLLTNDCWILESLEEFQNYVAWLPKEIFEDVLNLFRFTTKISCWSIRYPNFIEHYKEPHWDFRLFEHFKSNDDMSTDDDIPDLVNAMDLHDIPERSIEDSNKYDAAKWFFRNCVFPLDIPARVEDYFPTNDDLEVSANKDFSTTEEDDLPDLVYAMDLHNTPEKSYYTNNDSI
jgi:hypothetical protein